jgi:hypothetical protein
MRDLEMFVKPAWRKPRLMLMSGSHGIKEDQNANRNVERKACVHDVSEINEDDLVN